MPRVEQADQRAASRSWLAATLLMTGCAHQVDLLEESPGDDVPLVFVDAGVAMAGDASSYDAYTADGYGPDAYLPFPNDGSINNGGLDCNTCALLCPPGAVMFCDSGSCADAGSCSQLCSGCNRDASLYDASFYDASVYDASYDGSYFDAMVAGP